MGGKGAGQDDVEKFSATRQGSSGTSRPPDQQIMRNPDHGENTAGVIIEKSTPRVVFAQLLAGALGATSIQPSPMAIAYLVELLSDRVVNAPVASEDEVAADAEDATLTEALFAARNADGRLRIERLRALGDRALFISGFFGDSLNRKVVDLDFYRNIGRVAYSDLAGHIDRLGEPSWTELYQELALRFRDFVDVLAEISDRTLGSQPDNLLRLYERYILTRSNRDRDRLLRLGCVLPELTDGDHPRFWQ
jgi:hypothetical protein